VKFRFIPVLALLVLFSQAPSFADINSKLVKPVIRDAQSDESTYFIMTDRYENGDQSNDFGGANQSKSVSGFSPSEIGWWHGGDFKGITKNLETIKQMGFTSIWITPPVVQKYVQGDSAAYHGYWGVDFTTTDPHLGSESDFKEMVYAAHRLNLKVIIDVVLNHTADVIYYENGKPKVSKAEEKIKKPEWLNSISNYHNLGNDPLQGNSILDGDFFGLDDLATEKETVVSGWIDVWSMWINKFDIDGMRIDTFKHVNPEFWKKFIPKIKEVAAKAGKSDFPIFGEAADSDPETLATYVAGGQVSSVLDFAFQKKVKSFAQYGYSAEELAELFNSDDLYTTSRTNAYGLATFLGNHDMGRIGHFLSTAIPSENKKALLERAKLANAALFLLRGGPVTYYGDEKGFTGTGGDKSARQDMFATKVLEWQAELRIGSGPIVGESSFSVKHPLEIQITELQRIIAENPGLRKGNQEVRAAKNGILVLTRRLGSDEYIVALNGGDTDGQSNFSLGSASNNWDVILGNCKLSGSDSLDLQIPARDYCVYKAKQIQSGIGSIKISTPKVIETGLPSGWREISTQVTGANYAEVTFSARVKGKNWVAIGTSDRRTFTTTRTKGGLYRVYLHPEDFKKGSTIELIAAVVADKKDRVGLSKIIKVKI
jgi:glycosidase